MDELILNGIICLHDLPIEDDQINKKVIFLHNELKPLALLFSNFAGKRKNKISVSYFISDTKKTENELKEELLNSILGIPDCYIGTTVRPYSEITPDLFWEHNNEFYVGNHDMNQEFGSYIGKWVLIRISK